MPAPDDAGLDEPLVPGATVEDASLLRRFAAEYGLALVAGGGFAMLRSGSPAHMGATPPPVATAVPVVTVDAHPADFQALSATGEAALLTAAFQSMSSPAADNARNDLLAAP